MPPEIIESHFIFDVIMKQLLISLLAIIYIGYVLQPVITFVDFVINREALTEKYCVNVNEPALDCRASCFLELELAIDQSSSTSPVITKSNQLLNSYKKHMNPHMIDIVFNKNKTILFLSSRDHFIRHEYLLDILSPPPQV